MSYPDFIQKRHIHFITGMMKHKSELFLYYAGLGIAIVVTAPYRSHAQIKESMLL